VKPRAGVLLCGCGAYDGSDPQETVLAIHALQAAGMEVVPLVPDGLQLHVVDHSTGQESEQESRNMMVESARLVRGKLYLLQELSPKLLEYLVIPGGQGAGKNLLLGFGSLQTMQPPPEISAFIRGVHESGGIIGAISLAEFLLSSVLGSWPDGKGCLDLGPEEILVDVPGRRLLAPGNLLATSLPQLSAGINNLVREMMQIPGKREL
jgi:enhancing lycopene biosynthesis protein 2